VDSWIEVSCFGADHAQQQLYVSQNRVGDNNSKTLEAKHTSLLAPARFCSDSHAAEPALVLDVDNLGDLTRSILLLGIGWLVLLMLAIASVVGFDCTEIEGVATTLTIQWGAIYTYSFPQSPRRG